MGPDIDRAAAQWGWLLTELGYQPFQEWTGGCSWRLADTYIVIEQSPTCSPNLTTGNAPGSTT